MNAKRKGSQGERELAALLQSRGLEARRNDQRYVGGLHNPDIALTMGGHDVHVEVKRVERLNIQEAMNQAIRDADGQAMPVVAHRRNRGPWLVTMRLEDALGVWGYGQ